MWFGALSLCRPLIKQVTIKGLAPDGMRIGRSVSLCSTLPGHSQLSRKECASRPVLGTAVGLRVHVLGTQGKSWRQIQLRDSVCYAPCGWTLLSSAPKDTGHDSEPPVCICVGQSCVASLVNEITLLSCPTCDWMVPYSFFLLSLNSDGAETRFNSLLLLL